MTKLTKTQRAILDMMRENTGRHILDSGGTYGRHWERNQEKTDEDLMNYFNLSLYENKDDNRISFDGLTISVFKYLDAALEFDEALNKSLYDFIETDDPNQDKSWFQNVEDWLEQFSHSNQEYTYNYENCLSQDVVMWQFDPDYTAEEDNSGFTYAVIMIHNGCDARGGFTAPKVFKLNDDYSLYNYDNVMIYCPNCDNVIDYSHGECLNREGITISDLSEYIKTNDDNKCLCAKCNVEMKADQGIC